MLVAACAAAVVAAVLVSGRGSKSGWIAFTSTRDLNGEIYVMNADGGGQRRLTRSKDENDTAPTWSPAGREIAFMKSDGTDRRRVPVLRGRIDSPVWSPDGRKLAFMCIGAVWSPDGRSIAFERLAGGRADIDVVNQDGTGEKRLTSGGGKNGSSVWRP